MTNVPNIFAIGDVIGPPWLAHVASHEGIHCVEYINGFKNKPIDYNNIPGCTYCQPQVASVGYTEDKAKEAGYKIKVGKLNVDSNPVSATNYRVTSIPTLHLFKDGKVVDTVIGAVPEAHLQSFINKYTNGKQ